MGDGNAFLEWIWTDLINGLDPRSVAVGGRPPDEPFADATEALGRIRTAGVAVEDVARVLRADRYETAFALLYQIFERGLSGKDLHGLHESLLGADPSGRDGRPGSWPAPAEPAGGDVLQIKSSYQAVFSPDGTRLATLPTVPSIWDLRAGKVAVKCELPKQTSRIAWSPDGAILAGVNADGRVGLCRAATGKKIRELKAGREGSFLSFSPDGRQIVFADWDGTVWIWDAKTGKLARRLEHEGQKIQDAAFSPDGRALWISLTTPGKGAAGALVRWNWPPAAAAASRLDVPPIDRLAFHPRGHELAVIGWPGVLKVIDPVSGAVLRGCALKKLAAAAWSPKGDLLAVTGEGRVFLLDAATLKEKTSWDFEYPSSVAFSPDGRRLAIGDWSRGQVREI